MVDTFLAPLAHRILELIQQHARVAQDVVKRRHLLMAVVGFHRVLEAVVRERLAD
jgi:hypothetical protein